MTLSAETVREFVRRIFETAFPRNIWATMEDQESFSKLAATNTETLFSVPTGVGNDMKNFTPADLLFWIRRGSHLQNDIKVTKFITSEMLVSGNTASFELMMVVDCGKTYVSAPGRAMIEVTADGKLKRWIESFDVESFNRDLTQAQNLEKQMQTEYTQV